MVIGGSRLLGILGLVALSLAACGEDGEPACEGGQTRCGVVCVDLMSNEANCGACDHACGAVGVCVGGICQGCACPAPWVCCADACANLSTDSANCGECGHACQAHEACIDGGCVSYAGDRGLQWCSDHWVALDVDEHHCGACDRACDPGKTCLDGRCGCRDGLAWCGDGCFHLPTDERHCGACAQVCAGRCVNGVCEERDPRPLDAAVPDAASEPANGASQGDR